MSSDTAKRSAGRRRPAFPGVLLGLYAMAAGGAAVAMAAWEPAGWGCYSRPVLGTLGWFGGWLLLARNPSWRVFLLFWAFAQAVWVAPPGEGPLTAQPGPGLLVPAGLSGMVEGVRDLWSGYGVDLGGVLVLLVAWAVSASGWVPVPDEDSPRRPGGWIRELALIWMLVLVAAGGWMAMKPLAGRDAVCVIQCRLPGTSVYLDDKWAGLSPVYMSPADLAAHGMSTAGSTAAVQWVRAGTDAGWMLAGDQKAAMVGFRAPWFCRGSFPEAATPAGPRALATREKDGSFRLLSAARPGLVLMDKAPAARECGTNAPLDIPLELRFNAPGSGAKPAGSGAAVLRVSFAQADARSGWSRRLVAVTNVPLPESWGRIGAGESQFQTVTVRAPGVPGLYRMLCVAELAPATNAPARTAPRQAAVPGLVRVR